MKHPGPYLTSNASLATGDWMTSDNGAFYVIMQADANLCVYQGGGPSTQGALLWQSCPGGRPLMQYELRMQTNGQAVVQGSDGSQPWIAPPSPSQTGNYYFCIANDSQLSIMPGLPPLPGENPSTATPLWENGVHWPVTRIVLTGIDYALDQGKVVSSQPLEIYRETVANTSGSEQTSTVTAETNTTWTAHWADTVGATVVVSTDFSTNIPFLAEGRIQTSVEVSNSYEFGETETKEKKWQLAMPVSVPAGAAIEVLALVTEAEVSVPYSIDTLVTLQSGSQYPASDEGVFTGVSSSDLDVQFKNVPLPVP